MEGIREKNEFQLLSEDRDDLKVEKNKVLFRNILFTGILILYLIIIILLLRDNLQWFDLPLTMAVQSLESPLLTEIMKFFSFIGSTWVVIIIAFINIIFFFFVFKYRSEVIFFVVTLSGSTLLNSLLKNLFERERPISHRLIEAPGYSFPSGHSMAAFTLYAVLAILLWNHLKTKTGKTITIIVLSLFIFAIGISRIYLGVHYPSDVLGGYLTSFIWVFISMHLFNKTRGRFACLKKN